MCHTKLWIIAEAAYRITQYEIPLDWIELLAYLAAENGNNFRNFKTGQIDSVVDKLRDGKTMEMLAQDMKYYDYYHEAYTAILSGLVGDYEIEVPDETSPTGKRWERKYGLKAFCPIAKNYYYSHYYDFGAGRSYGFFRRHLGHDMIGVRRHTCRCRGRRHNRSYGLEPVRRVANRYKKL